MDRVRECRLTSRSKRGGGRDLRELQFPEFEIVHSEYSLTPSPIDARHVADPIRLDETQGMVCVVCLKTVEWTGIAADDPENRSGKTIPGPWVHVPTT